MKPLALLGFVAASASGLNCDLQQYSQQAGLRAAATQDTLRIEWDGERGSQLRMAFAVEVRHPIVREIAVRASGGAWIVLGRDLKPEFDVVAGVRRISNQQLQPMRALKIDTPERIEVEKWNVFWDAPLNVPGVSSINPGTPRKSEEIRRGAATFATNACKVKTDGARLEVSFDGLSLGIFSGRLQFTVYRGSNLIRQEAIASTQEPSVAYKYDGGLKGFRTPAVTRVAWRDTSRSWQEYEFGGAPNESKVALRARNRVAFLEGGGGSLAVLPPPHKFFWAREIEKNLGYVWYRKDAEGNIGIGVRQAEREEMYTPHGVSNELWDKRVKHSRRFAEGNFALFNAPPGTWQRMAVYFYASAGNASETLPLVLAYTHDDQFKSLPGYQVAVSHFHTAFGEFVSDEGSLDSRPPWLPAFRALGVNIAMMSDFHGDGHPEDHGPLRFPEQHVYFEASKRHSDRKFLIMPGEEPDAHLAGHYTMVFPKPVYWTKGRGPGQSFIEQHPKYGAVYHVGSAAEELQMLQREKGLVWQAHPRAKGSTGYPDAIRETAHFRSDRFLGGAYQSLPVDLSESRLCEKRCFSTLDDMNNWGAPKYLIAEGDTYAKFPEDELYTALLVNYVKLVKLPAFHEDWSPILNAMRAGNFFVTSGEVLIHSSAIEGTGPKRRMVADVEWTFPLEFVEVVWGDGDSTGRQIVSATAEAPFGRKRFEIPFDAAGRKWVRFAAWDSAGNGGFTQPVHLK